MKKINQDQQGIAHLLLIALAVIVGLGIGLAVKQVMSNQKNSSKTNNQAVSEKLNIKEDKEMEAACLKRFDDKNLCKFASRAQLEGIDSKTVIKTSGSGGDYTMTVETDENGNTFATTSQGGNEQVSTISLKDATYVKMAGSDSWTKYPKTTSETENISAEVEVKAEDLLESDTSSFKFMGKEACGNLTCFKYQAIDSSMPGAENFLWFDDKDYLVRKITSTEGGNTSTIEVTYPEITIKAPTSYKDAP